MVDNNLWPFKDSVEPISLGNIPSCFSYIGPPKTSKNQDFNAKLQAIDAKTLTTLFCVIFSGT
jgi:hypothetical protein